MKNKHFILYLILLFSPLNLKDIFVQKILYYILYYILYILGLPERRFRSGPPYLPERRPAPSVTRPSESQHCPALSLSVSSSLSRLKTEV